MIYSSPYPTPTFVSTSIYSHVFGNEQSYNPESPACIDAISGEVVTRRELREGTLKIGAALREDGATPGDVSLILSPNSLAWPFVVFGNIAAGLIITPANPSYTPSELAHQLKNSGAKRVFVHPTLLPVALEALKLTGLKDEDELRDRIVIMSYTQEDEEAERKAKIARKWTRLSDLLNCFKSMHGEIKFEGEDAKKTVLMCYSSGTTGLSKGVETTHHNLTVALQAFEMMWPRDPSHYMGLAVLPLFHILHVTVLLSNIRQGIPFVIMPRFDALLFFSTIEKYKVTRIFLVPPMLVVMANHPLLSQNKYDMSSLRLLLSAAAPLGAGLMQKALEKLKEYGNNHVRLIQSYGLTETSPLALVMLADEYEHQGSCGRVGPGVLARLVDDDENDVVQTHVEGKGHIYKGELWMKGPSIMKGYYNNPTATNNSITPDGWFKSGDIAEMDAEGYFTIVDRKKELIKYKGFQVPPAELEALLLTRPDIFDAAVIGVMSEEQATELPRAYIVPSPSISASTKSEQARFVQDIHAWMRTKVAHHKFLRGGIVLAEAIPKSAAGKILRRELRDMAKGDFAILETPKSKL